jgi:hypothetical protein
MKKIFYKKIGSVYLYDHQLNRDYLIFSNRIQESKLEIIDDEIVFIKINEFSNSLPFEFSSILTKIYNSTDKNESVKLMKEVCEKLNLPFVKLETPLLYVRVAKTHLENYNAYEVFYPLINGDIGDYELAHSWNVGNSTTSTFRVYEY